MYIIYYLIAKKIIINILEFIPVASLWLGTRVCYYQCAQGLQLYEMWLNMSFPRSKTSDNSIVNNPNSEQNILYIRDMVIGQSV